MTGEPGMTGYTPPATLKDINDVIINDVNGKIDTDTTQTIDLDSHFHPMGLEYSVSSSAPVESRVSAMLDESDDSMLTVGLKDEAGYQNNLVTVKASDGTLDQSLSFNVRRNRPPTRDDTRAGANSFLGAATEIIDVTVGTQAIVDKASATRTAKIKTVDAPDVADAEFGIATPAFGIAVDDVPTGIWFLDDIGNVLSFEGETALVADRSKIMITGAAGEISFLGLASTGDGNDDAATAIKVLVRAVDGGGLNSQAVEMFEVTVDAAPKTTGNIGNRGATEGGKAYVDDVQDYFMDDLNDFTTVDTTTLNMYAWSDDPEIATVAGNPTNSRTKPPMLSVAVTGVVGADALVIDGKGVGEATITVRVEEPIAAGDGAVAQLGQWAEHTFLVRVSKN
jgi:hypothetical protein